MLDGNLTDHNSQFDRDYTPRQKECNGYSLTGGRLSIVYTGVWHRGQVCRWEISVSKARCLQALHIQNWYSIRGRPVTIQAGNLVSQLGQEKDLFKTRNKQTWCICIVLNFHNDWHKLYNSYYTYLQICTKQTGLHVKYFMYLRVWNTSGTTRALHLVIAAVTRSMSERFEHFWKIALQTKIGLYTLFFKVHCFWFS